MSKKTANMKCKSHPIHNAYEFNESGKYRLRGTDLWSDGKKGANKYVFCTIRGEDVKKQTSTPLHRAMWETFQGIIPDGYEIDHIDNNKENNNIKNLQCITISENRKRRDHTFLIEVREAKKNKPTQKVKSINLLNNDFLIFKNKSRCASYFGCSPALIYYVCEKLNYARTCGGHTTFEYTDEEVTKEVPRKEHIRKKGGYKYKTPEEKKEAQKESAKRYIAKFKLNKLANKNKVIEA
jgi:hypothetical protein